MMQRADLIPAQRGRRRTMQNLTAPGLRRTPLIVAAHNVALQRKAAGISSANHSLGRNSITPSVVDEASQAPAQPLGSITRAFFERRIGHDFGDVRVHTNAAADESARALNALAYTIGRNIVFRSDRYEPSSKEGRALLAHELTHVVQQAKGQGIRGSEPAAETEANNNAAAIRGSGPLDVKVGAPRNVLQRQPTAADAETKEKEGSSDIDKVVKAAERARRKSGDGTAMMINGAEIVYRLVHAFLPDYDDKMSGVGYRAGVKDVDVQGNMNSISITVGDEFILATTAATIEKRALDLGRAIFAKAPRPAAKGKLHGLVGGMFKESLQPPPAETRAPPPPPDPDVPATFALAVPGLGPEKTTQVEELIKKKDRQAAVDLVVQNAGTGMAGGTSIETKLLENGKMKYDREVTWADGVTGMPSWDYIHDKAEPCKVRIGPGAFSSAPYLYSVIIHEYQHVLWDQSLKNQEIGRETHEEGRQGGGAYSSEVEAYVYELLHLEESGLAKVPEKIAEVWGHLNDEFWTLDQPTRNKMSPKVQRALSQAQRFVKGTKVTLDPFRQPSDN